LYNLPGETEKKPLRKPRAKEPKLRPHAEDIAFYRRYLAPDKFEGKDLTIPLAMGKSILKFFETLQQPQPRGRPTHPSRAKMNFHTQVRIGRKEVQKLVEQGKTKTEARSQVAKKLKQKFPQYSAETLKDKLSR
jgi:hypothetical protein